MYAQASWTNSWWSNINTHNKPFKNVTRFKYLETTLKTSELDKWNKITTDSIQEMPPAIHSFNHTRIFHLPVCYVRILKNNTDRISFCVLFYMGMKQRHLTIRKNIDCRYSRRDWCGIYFGLKDGKETGGNCIINSVSGLLIKYYYGDQMKDKRGGKCMYEGHLESKECFAIQRYLLIIGKKKNMQVLWHTFTYFST